MSSYRIELARLEDADELLKLYYRVYGPDYPLPFGTDRTTMLATIASPSFVWLVARPEAGPAGTIAGSVVVDVDLSSRIGKVTGLVVHPEHRRHSLGNRLVSEGTSRVLGGPGGVNSVYATTRTQSVSPQLTFLRDGFVPLGIFPNAHKLQAYETLTLMAKFAPGVLERRVPVAKVPYELGGLLAILEDQYGIRTPCEIGTLTERADRAYLSARATREAGQVEAGAARGLEFERIYAPQFVRRLFDQKMSDPYDRFYPFHTPNMLLTSTDGSIEIYAYFSRKDRYCAIVSLNVAVHELSGRLAPLFTRLKDEGVAYVELLLDLRYTRSIEAALGEGFVPSAFYPAMRELDGQTYDFAILSRTLEPLNFKGMTIERSFKPFVDQYVRLWTESHLLSLEVYDVR